MATKSAPQSTFDGFARPNYTQVPDELFDVLLPQLADNELRVLLYIIRRTFGFKRESDTISLSQMVKGITTKDGQVLDSGTGMSKSTVARATKSLREKGIIVATRNASKEKGDQPTTYRLRFKSDSNAGQPDMINPLSHQQDTPRVPSMRQAVSHEWDTQETGEQETDFEYSKGGNLGSEMGEWDQVQPYQTTSRSGEETDGLSNSSLGAILNRRIKRDVGRDARGAITVAMERFAEELGDQAELKVSVARALNLYQAAEIGVGAFVDLLYQARGEVLDRHRYPGKAPVPRNRMAYFFAVVEDRLGLKERAE